MAGERIGGVGGKRLRGLGRGGVVLAGLALAAPAWAVYDPVFRDGFDPVPTYYVSVATGSDANPGTLARPWKTIGKAVSAATALPPGAVVYIAPGTYNEQVTVARDDIALVGYRNTPGDQPPILANLAPTGPGAQTPTLPAFNPADMPLLDGGDRSADTTGITIRERHGVSVRNINIRRYGDGVFTGHTASSTSDPALTFRESHDFFNVNVRSVGNTSASYDGMGFKFGSMSTQFANGNRVRNALVIDAAAEGVKFNGNDNEADNLRVYGTEGDGAAATDYYVIVTGSRNRIRNSYIWRKPGSDHSGHGYTLKDNADQITGNGVFTPCEDNLLENNTAVNMNNAGFAVRHRGVKNNLFIDNVAYGTFHGDDCDGSGIMVRDGASDNRFFGTRVYNVCSAVKFEDTVEDGGATETPSMNNLISDLQADTVATAIGFTRWGANDPLTDAGANTITDSSFLLAKYLFRADRPSYRMSYVNTAFTGSAGVFPGAFFVGGAYQTDVVPSQFTNCTFDAIDGGLPPWW